MKLRFETVGNAILQLFENDKPILATDPWLTGTAYFGSWALDHELTDQQIRNVIQSPYVWISHGHPDHLHPESIDLLSPDQEILLPNQYFPEIADWFREKGFEVRILKFKEWVRLSSAIRVMRLENDNQDTVLIVEDRNSSLVTAPSHHRPAADSGFCRHIP